MWHAPPMLAGENPYSWRKLLATAGPTSQASEGQWNQLSRQLSGALIAPLTDLQGVEARHLELVSENEEICPPQSEGYGELWKLPREHAASAEGPRRPLAWARDVTHFS